MFDRQDEKEGFCDCFGHHTSKSCDTKTIYSSLCVLGLPVVVKVFLDTVQRKLFIILFIELRFTNRSK